MISSCICLALLVAAPVLAVEQVQTPPLPYQLPAKMEHHRFFIEAQAPSGQVLRLFTDTGGGMNLTTSGAHKLGVAYQLPAGRQRHRDWQYLEKSDIGMPMIRVPDIEITGYHTGPAWFSVRPDKAFHEYMAQWMDRPVDGALGGEAFRSFRISVDYPSATAVFEQ